MYAHERNNLRLRDQVKLVEFRCSRKNIICIVDRSPKCVPN